jgi:hypothetical protein
MPQIQPTVTLCEEDVWQSHRNVLWKARRFIGPSGFYPIYRYRDFYSYSLLSLIRKKRTLLLNPLAERASKDPLFQYAQAHELIDNEIERLGGPIKFRRVLKDPDEACRRIAEAMVEDMRTIEQRNRGYTNVILCGGRDSLNLLFLPWSQPTIVASAPPNLALVRNFVRDNELEYDVLPLSGEGRSPRKEEVLVNCCRLNLEHCRWSADLIRIAREHENKVVFWLGQLGDTFLTPYWKTYRPDSSQVRSQPGGISDLGRLLPHSLKRVLGNSWADHRAFARALWARGAMWQGTHMSLLRELTNALVLSGYHGPSMSKALCDIDLRLCVHEDIRARIGVLLKGAKVKYPQHNPSPLPWQQGRGFASVGRFLEFIDGEDIRIVGS